MHNPASTRVAPLPSHSSGAGGTGATAPNSPSGRGHGAIAERLTARGSWHDNLTQLMQTQPQMRAYLPPLAGCMTLLYVVGMLCFALAPMNSAADYAREIYTDAFVLQSAAAAAAFFSICYADVMVVALSYAGSPDSVAAPRAAMALVCAIAGCTHLLHALKLMPVIQPDWGGNLVTPAKIFTWCPTNALIIFSLSEVLQLSSPAVFFFMGTQALTVLTGLTSVYAPPPGAYILLVVSSLSFLPFVATTLYISLRLHLLISIAQGGQVRFIGASTVLLWCCFPVIFFLGAAGALSSATEAMAFIYIDVLTKLVFTSAIMAYKFKEDTRDNLRQLMHLTDANKAQRQFLRYVFHEVRVPFNSVMLGIEYLLMEDEMRDYEGLLLTMKQAGETMSRTLDDVLSLAKIEEGKLQLESRVFSLAAVLDNTLQQFRPGLEAKALRMRYGFDPSIPAALAGDDHRLGQVVSNFISNAIKFSREGGTVEVMLLCRDRSQLKCNIEISVADWGVGISQEDQRHLFQAYAQIRPGELQKSRGTGLGLAIAKHIVELQGGKITLESTEGCGSRFTSTIPFLVADALPSSASAARRTSTLSLCEVAAETCMQGSIWPRAPPPLVGGGGGGGGGGSGGEGSLRLPGARGDNSDLGGTEPFGHSRTSYRYRAEQENSPGTSIGRAGIGSRQRSSPANLGGRGASQGSAGALADAAAVTAGTAAAVAAAESPAAAAAMAQMALIFQQYCDALDHMLVETVRVALPYAAVTAAGGSGPLPVTLKPVESTPWRGFGGSGSSGGGGSGGGAEDGAGDEMRGQRGSTEVSGIGGLRGLGSDEGDGDRAAAAHFQSQAAELIRAMEAAVLRRRQSGLETLQAVRGSLTSLEHAAASSPAGTPTSTPVAPSRATSAGALPSSSPSGGGGRGGGGTGVWSSSAAHGARTVSLDSWKVQPPGSPGGGGGGGDGSGVGSSHRLTSVDRLGPSPLLLLGPRGGARATVAGTGSAAVVDLSGPPVLLEEEPLTALVVDDVLSNRSLVMMLLRRMGWVCDSAADGRQAVEAAARRPYDIILMDNVMPNMTGVEATMAIKRASPDAVIVGVTGNALEEDKVAFRQAGAREVLTKPIRKQDLQNELNAVAAMVRAKRRLGSTVGVGDGDFNRRGGVGGGLSGGGGGCGDVRLPAGMTAAAIAGVAAVARQDCAAMLPASSTARQAVATADSPTASGTRRSDAAPSPLAPGVQRQEIQTLTGSGGGNGGGGITGQYGDGGGIKHSEKGSGDHDGGKYGSGGGAVIQVSSPSVRHSDGSAVTMEERPDDSATAEEFATAGE